MVVSRRIRTYGIKVLAGDLVNKKKGDMVEENGEQRSKEEFIEYVEDPDSCTIHDILTSISGCKVKVFHAVLFIVKLTIILTQFVENEMKAWFDIAAW